MWLNSDKNSIIDDPLNKNHLNLKGVESLVLTNHRVEIKFIKNDFTQSNNDEESYVFNKN